jgi:uncharacterized protein
MQPDQTVIQALVSQIVKAAQPLQVVLFGSGARGTMQPGSDIDLMVVMPDGTHRRKTAQRLYRAISGVKTPFDLLVATPDDLEKHKNNIGLIYRVVLQEGQVVYAIA